MDELLIEPEPTERELGTAPIKPLFARYAAITFAGMLAQMVMVVLEGLIIGNGLGPLGLAAVTVILPLELLNLALGGALGMGTAAAAGQRLGSGDTAGAQKVFNQGFWLCLLYTSLPENVKKVVRMRATASEPLIRPA